MGLLVVAKVVVATGVTRVRRRDHCAVNAAALNTS
jgi:hypothetical protein